MKINYANVTSTLALLFAVATGGAFAADRITSRDIPPNTIKSSDLAKNSVRSSDVRTAAITGSDIGDGQVQARDVTLPAPAQLRGQAASKVEPPPSDYALIAAVGSYEKNDATSTLQIEWTGTAIGRNEGEAGGCVFQIRVDGQPSSAGGGQVFVGGSEIAVSASVLFPGVTAGPHNIEVWAKGVLPDSPMGVGDRCEIGPPVTSDIGQTFVVSEIVS